MKILKHTVKGNYILTQPFYNHISDSLKKVNNLSFTESVKVPVMACFNNMSFVGFTSTQNWKLESHYSSKTSSNNSKSWPVITGHWRLFAALDLTSQKLMKHPFFTIIVENMITLRQCLSDYLSRVKWMWLNNSRKKFHRMF